MNALKMAKQIENSKKQIDILHIRLNVTEQSLSQLKSDKFMKEQSLSQNLAQQQSQLQS